MNRGHLAALGLALLLALPVLATELTFRQKDLLGLEVVQNARRQGENCMRAWIAQRDAIVRVDAGGAVIGTYGEIVTARPLGLVSMDAGCRYPIPGDNGTVFDSSMWNLYGRSTASKHWQLAATITIPGELQRNSTPQLVLEQRSDSTYEFRWTRGNPTGDLLFERLPKADEASKELHTIVDSMVRRISGNDCIAATMAIETMRADPGRIRMVCDLRRRARELSGGVSSVAINSVEQFSRVPIMFPAAGTSGPWTDGTGALVRFTSTLLDNQRLFGDMLLIRESDVWRISSLWY